MSRFWLETSDCVEFCRKIPSDSISLTVTSPPYDKLRKYEKGSQYDIDSLITELYRITKPQGFVIWVCADATIQGGETCTSFNSALRFADRFKLFDTMIYLKSSQPRQNGVRYEQCFEYMFVFSKGISRAVNLLTEPCQNAGRKVKRTCRDKGGDQLLRSENLVAQHKPRGNVWFYGSKHNKSPHPAVFPVQLALDHVESWSNIGDLVLDPFTGSGTTGEAALSTGRNFLGCDISSDYIEYARGRFWLSGYNECSGLLCPY